VKPIHRLIEHLVNNWQNNLLEALAPKIKQQLMTKFKDEAEDFDIVDPVTKKIPTEKQISDWIDYFDSKLRNSPKVTEKDITKYSLAELIKLVSSYKGSPEEKEEDEQIEENPDIVYQENGIVVYSGHNEENCIKFGKGEQWCITRGSFGTYRYDQRRKNPTFYLVKNTNLPTSNKSSFIVIVVGSDNTYKVSDRSNNDIGGRGTEWDRWEPWSTVENLFPFLQGLQRVFKYIPISKSEALSQMYKTNSMTFEDWSLSSPSFKEQYIIVRKGARFFHDITNEKFLSKYVAKYPAIAELIAKNYGMVNLKTLFEEFDAFTPNLQSSIIENAKRFTSLDTKTLFLPYYDFSAKRAATKRGLIKPTSDERVYVTSDDKGIVLLDFDSKIPKIRLVTPDKTYENIKVNERTIKLLTNYPNLDELPFSALVNLAKENLLPSQVISRIVTKAKSDPNSAIIIKDTEEGQILVDSNTFTAYKIENDAFTSIPFIDDTVQNIVQNETENSNFQDKVISILSSAAPILADAMPGITAILKNTPYNRRLTIAQPGDNDGASGAIFLVNETKNTILRVPSADKTSISDFLYYSNRASSGNKFTLSHFTPDKSDYQTWMAYLRSQNIAYNTTELIAAIRRYGYVGTKSFLLSNPPLTEDNTYQIVEWEGEVFLVNKANSRESLKISNSTNKAIKANIPPTLAARMRGVEAPPAEPTRRERPTAAAAAPATQEPGVRRPGRPAGRTAAPAAPVNAAELTAATTAMTDAGLINSWNALSTPIKNRFANATVTNRIFGDRGAGRRDNILRGRGRVRRIVEQGNNKIYIIQLQNDVFVASIVLQPGNAHLLVTSAGTTNIGSPDNLLATLQNQNLTESEKGMAINMFLAENPHMLDETKEILRKHLNKNKYETQRS
jgi:hypothetical protein